MQKGGVRWVSGTFKLLFCICCFCISSNAYDFSSYVNVTHSWKNNLLIEGGSFKFNDLSIARTILYSQGHGTEYPPFGFGFFSNQTSDSFILAIYIGSLYDYVGSSPVVVWSANRDHPVGENATLDFTAGGNLVLRDGDGSFVWSPNTSGISVRSVNLNYDGNLILLDGNGSTIWESFDYPTDTILYGQSFHKGQRLTSSISTSNYSSGLFYVTWEADGLHAFADLNPPQEYGFCDYKTFIFYNRSYLQDQINKYMPFDKMYSYMRLDQRGQLSQFTWNRSESYPYEIPLFFSETYVDVIDGCEWPTTCGKYGICEKGGKCGCPIGDDGSRNYFKPVDPFDTSLGCNLVTPLSCPNTHKLHNFLKLDNVTYFVNTPTLIGTNVESCKSACLSNCSCKAVFFHYYKNDISSGNCTLPSDLLTLIDTSGAGLKYKAVAFIKVQNRVQNTTASTKAPKKTSLTRKLIPTVSTSVITMFLVTGAVFFYYVLMTRRSSATEFDGSLDIFVETVSRFSFESLKLATQDFQTKLGRGGFGSVYEGILADGTKVAVKQLDSLGQGRKEFLAEVNTIGNVHHFNLVSLIGFCDEGLHRLLVYVYMCNGSLEKWIFNQDISQTLNWNIRRKIIDGVAAGLEYLHEHCKLNIIHFDIKPQNILLDKDFNIKISDFGLAKMVARDESQVMTMVRGTPGYMAPEMITGRAISVKVDVYSFGVLVLEIVCGRRNFGSSEGDCLTNLVKVKADENQLSDLIDERGEGMQEHKEEVVKMMKIAIWCLQPHFIRPTMSMVVKVLQDLTNMETLTDLSFLTMVHEATPVEADYNFSVRPTESLLSGPR